MFSLHHCLSACLYATPNTLAVFLPSDACSAKLGIAIVSRPSVHLSSVTLMYRGRMCWVSSKLITRMDEPFIALIMVTDFNAQNN